VTEASLQDGLPTWRYYYNASFDNIHYPGFPPLGAFHGAELGMVWGTYPVENATQQEVELSAFMQAAWANFAKDPASGPGWKALDGTGNDLGCLGCNGSSGVQIIDENDVDSRCSLFAPLYQATSPYF
jgi:carboxylesterase type B